MDPKDLIKILEDENSCKEFQKKLSFPSASVQGIGTFRTFHNGKELALSHAMTLLNVVCPPKKAIAQFRDPDSGQIFDLSIYAVPGTAEKVLLGTLKGFAEYPNVEVEIGLTQVDLISK